MNLWIQKQLKSEKPETQQLIQIQFLLYLLWMKQDQWGKFRFIWLKKDYPKLYPNLFKEDYWIQLCYFWGLVIMKQIVHLSKLVNLNQVMKNWIHGLQELT